MIVAYKNDCKSFHGFIFLFFFHQVYVDHGRFRGHVISITKTTPSEANDNFRQDNTPYHHSVWIRALCKQL